jgi:hypothetical protein
MFQTLPFLLKGLYVVFPFFLALNFLETDQPTEAQGKPSDIESCSFV